MNKPPTEMHEGPDAFTRFDNTVKSLLSVSHDELVRREKAYKKQVAKNPKRRGPKNPKR